MINRAVTSLPRLFEHPLRIISAHFNASAILKNVSGFSNDIFLRGWDNKTLTNRLTLNVESQALQFIWPFTQNLPSMVEPTRDKDPSGIVSRVVNAYRPPQHVKAQ